MKDGPHFMWRNSHFNANVAGHSKRTSRRAATSRWFGIGDKISPGNRNVAAGAADGAEAFRRIGEAAIGPNRPPAARNPLPGSACARSDSREPPSGRNRSFGPLASRRRGRMRPT